MENKYPIYVNLLEEETLLSSRRRALFFRWLMVFVILIIAGTGINLYLISQTEKALSFNQLATLQVMRIQSEVIDLPGGISFIDLFQHKNMQVRSVTIQNISKVKIMEDIEQVTPSGVQFSEIYLSDKKIISGLAENYALIAQLMAGLELYPYCNNLTLSAVNQKNDLIEFKIEMD